MEKRIWLRIKALKSVNSSSVAFSLPTKKQKRLVNNILHQLSFPRRVFVRAPLSASDSSELCLFARELPLLISHIKPETKTCK